MNKFAKTAVREGPIESRDKHQRRDPSHCVRVPTTPPNKMGVSTKNKTTVENFSLLTMTPTVTSTTITIEHDVESPPSPSITHHKNNNGKTSNPVPSDAWAQLEKQQPSLQSSPKKTGTSTMSLDKSTASLDKPYLDVLASDPTSLTDLEDSYEDSDHEHAADSKELRPSSTTTTTSSTTSVWSSNQELLTKASQYIRPSRSFRWMIRLYADRHGWLLWALHTVVSMLIASHFAIIKFHQQQAAVPDAAPFRFWKVWVPVVEFGTMHLTLFQMALLPLTMARTSIAHVACHYPWVGRFVPLARMQDFHVYLGTLMVVLVTLATVVFLVFFGSLCRAGEQAFCDKFTSEIMATGYAIIASILIIGGTSWARRRIPYEIFYGTCHADYEMLQRRYTKLIMPHFISFYTSDTPFRFYPIRHYDCSYVGCQATVWTSQSKSNL